jgi:hypothetical protein
MGYGLLETYGLWYAFPRPPSRWTGLAMGYYRLWVFTGMGYNRFDCTTVRGVWRLGNDPRAVTKRMTALVLCYLCSMLLLPPSAWQCRVH